MPSLLDKGHTTLKVGQVISRTRIDRDVVFLNSPPCVHDLSVQDFNLYVHGDHIVKIIFLV
jgi:DNA-directed RNA polymerase-5 subunit 1